MGQRLEYTFLQRYAKDKQVYKKTINITNHEGNINQKHNEISPHTYQNNYHQKEHR